MKRTRTLDLPYVPFSAPVVERTNVVSVVTDARCKCCSWANDVVAKCWLAESSQPPPQFETEETCPYQEALLPRLAAQHE